MVAAARTDKTAIPFCQITGGLGHERGLNRDIFLLPNVRSLGLIEQARTILVRRKYILQHGCLPRSLTQGERQSLTRRLTPKIPSQPLYRFASTCGQRPNLAVSGPIDTLPIL